MPTAEMTEKELDALAAETLAEMQGDSPPPQRTEPAAKEAGPLAWRARGGWQWAGRGPLQFGAELATGNLLLEIRAQSDRAPDRQEIGFIRERDNETACAAVMTQLQATGSWTSFIEAKSELASIARQIEKTEESIQKIEEERIRLASKPRGQGSKILAIEEKVKELRQQVQGLEKERDVMTPIFQHARDAAKKLIRDIALEQGRLTREESQAELDQLIADFLAKNSEVLTKLAAHMQARQTRNHDVWIGSLVDFALARLEAAQPMPESATT